MRRNWPIYRQVFVLLKQYPKTLVALIIASFFSLLAEGLGLGLILPLLQPSLASNLLDQIPLLTPFSSPLTSWLDTLSLLERIRMAALLLLAVVLVRNVFVVATRFLALKIKQQVESGLKNDVFHQLHDVELRYIYSQQIGAFETTLTQFTWQSVWMVSYITAAIADLFALIVYTGIMLVVSWQLTLLAACLMLLVLQINNRLFLDRLNYLGAAERDEQKRNRTLALESLSAMKLLHLFRKEHSSLKRYEESLQAYQTHALNGKRLTALLMPVFSFLSVLVLSCLLLLGSYLMPEKTEALLAQLVLFILIIFRLMGPASKLNQMNGQVSLFAPAFQAVMDFLVKSDKPYLTDGTISFAQLQREIQFHDVTFRYGSEGATVLNKVSFTIPKGKMTALVGPSGSGKSTIVDLVARLYDCDDGSIEVDGVNVRQLTLTSWRTALAVVNQDTFLFNDSVRGNLRFVRPDATDSEIEKAVRLAHAHDFIMALPHGYDTMLGDRGVRLSGGQQQRIAIARAILADPQLLILDEATSDLDSQTERAIQHAIEEFGHNRTLLVVAHRLSTIRSADNIVVLDNGQVLAQGCHRELLDQDGVYRRLVKAQNLDKDDFTIPPAPQSKDGS